jgi:hypothetical protein
MAKKQSDEEPAPPAGVRFSIPALIAFSVSLVLAGGLLSTLIASTWYKRLERWTLAQTGPGADSEAVVHLAPQEMPPWGQLVAREIEVERPEEYLASELSTYQIPRWVFEGQSGAQASNLMVACGLTVTQVGRALSPALATMTSTNVVIQPDEELVYSLSPETRSKFYAELARWPVNHFMQYPFCLPGDRTEASFENSNLSDAFVARLKKVLYVREGTTCLSDFEILMRSLPTETEKLWAVKALSRQRGVLVRVRIWPDTDIDKMLGYWDRGVQVKDARPLLESIKRLPDGGTMSLLYLLPRFARDRLYTFPTPPQASDPPIDCHWSTMNFFNDTPDNRFGQPSFTAEYLKTNCYSIAKPNLYGDIVLVLDEKGNGIHSALYLAEDIVFTKNGNNYAQPWMLMRLKDLLSGYAPHSKVKLAAYRRKGW